MTIPTLADSIWEGDVLNMSTNTRIGGIIRHMFRDAFVELNGGQGGYLNCPNHDALVVKYDGRLWLGDCVVWQKCHLTSVYQYEQWLGSGHIYALRVLRVPGLTPEQAAKASEYWNEKVKGTPYDVYAFPRLLFKATFGDYFPCAAGMTWAHWCSESCMESLKKAKADPYKTLNPTPFTSYKRSLIGKFETVAYFNAQQWLK